jgi:hypothetical protein
LLPRLLLAGLLLLLAGLLLPATLLTRILLAGLSLLRVLVRHFFSLLEHHPGETMSRTRQAVPKKRVLPRTDGTAHTCL